MYVRTFVEQSVLMVVVVVVVIVVGYVPHM
jgi:hypothetical protein